MLKFHIHFIVIFLLIASAIHINNKFFLNDPTPANSMANQTQQNANEANFGFELKK